MAVTRGGRPFRWRPLHDGSGDLYARVKRGDVYYEAIFRVDRGRLLFFRSPYRDFSDEVRLGEARCGEVNVRDNDIMAATCAFIDFLVRADNPQGNEAV